MNLLNLKIAFRYLFKNKMYSFINILGLSLGIAAFIIISLYVSYEKSYDTFDGSDQVYRAFMDYSEGGDFVPGDAQTYNLTGPTLQKEFPEITDNVRLYRLEKVIFLHNDKVIEQPSGALSDSSYFDIFNTEVTAGSISKFNRPNTIVISERLAEKLFGDENPISKIISAFYETETQLEVVAVIPNMPETTHMNLNFLISFETINTWEAFEGQGKLNWNTNNFFTYLKVNKNTNFEELQQKVINTNIENDWDERHNIERLADIHLHSDKPYEAQANGSISRVRFLSVIAIIILILSWLNYINLSTVKSLERSKEIGIRKVAGAQRPQLIAQSLTESIFLFVIAIFIAIVLVILLLPVFNNFVGKSLVLGSNIKTLLPFLGLMVLGSLLAGFYPALILSSFSPVKALKGKISTNPKRLNIRKGLITIQFFATIILLIGTLVVSKQINFLKEQPIGVELTKVVALKGEVLVKQEDSLLEQKIKVLKSELRALSFVDGVAISNTYPGDGYDSFSSTVGISYPDGTEHDRQLFYIYGAGSEYFDVVGLQFVAGNAFLPNVSDQVVLNETFAHTMGYLNVQDIVGKSVKFWGESWKVAGVIADYHHFGLKTKIEPLIIGPQNKGKDNVLIKMATSGASMVGIQDKLDQIKNKWSEIFPQSTLNYTFLDKKFDAQYTEDRKFGIAFQIFTGLAIFIAALGLFGLTSYICLQRRKEIGIRKVTGASTFQILKLLNKDFIMLVVVAFIIAVPVGWYIMNNWLQEFAYRTDLNWWLFALAAVIAVLIALFTVSVQSIKAATSNPVRNLRTE